MRCWLWIALTSLAVAAPAHAQPEAAVRGGGGPPPPEQGAASDAPAFRWPGTLVWDLELRLHIPPETDFDRALSAHRYGGAAIIPAFAGGLAVPVVPWLWIGGQLGVRGRTWTHIRGNSASLVAADALATVRARIPLGRRVEIGALVGGGLGWIGTWLNGVSSDQLAPRFSAQADLLFAIDRHFAFGPSVGWDFFQTPSAINAYGHVADAGGFFFGLSLEGRE